MNNMKIYFSQIYIEVGVNFPFDYKFQVYISNEITRLVEPSVKFINNHGDDYDLTFNVSAKERLKQNEIVGPAIYKKDKDVEYSIFLPYTPIMKQAEPNRSALEYLFEGVYKVLQQYEMDTKKVKDEEINIINTIISSPEMLRP